MMHEFPATRAFPDVQNLFLGTVSLAVLFPLKAMRGVLNLDLYDVEAAERGEKQLSQFLERRSKDSRTSERDRAFENELEARERRRMKKRRAENRRVEINNLGHLHRVYLGAAARVADRRSRLMLEGGDEPDQSPGPEEAA
jgi:hypothetical protein